MSADLWSPSREQSRRAVEPLALRMRPRTLAEFAGQEHIVGEGRLLRRMLAPGKRARLTSIILHGPPGTGKTTLAEVIANTVGGWFERENAAGVGVKRIREIIDGAALRLESAAPGEGTRTILFLDEIHRFTRAQQDVLLGDVERGVITLIGATTENPMFAVNSALVSRSTVFRLEPLTEVDVQAIVRRAIADKERGYGGRNLTVADEAIAHWARVSDGDARRALTALEIAVMSVDADRQGSASADRQNSVRPDRQSPERQRGDTVPRAAAPVVSAPGSDGKDSIDRGVVIDLAIAQESIQQKALVYDGAGDEHFDTISAMIKSIRGSDPDAAVYWVARMLESGEDPRYIARRLAILASEDIGNADPRAIMVAAACWELVERVGMPEGRINLAQCAIYLALAPKSNASYLAIEEASADVRDGRTLPIPVFLRDGHKTPSVGSPKHGGAAYEYSHDAENKTSIGGVTGQDYLGAPREYYRPEGIGAEELLKKRLEEVRRMRRTDA